jgi:hypothetical protein
MSFEVVTVAAEAGVTDSGNWDATPYPYAIAARPLAVPCLRGLV